MHVLTSTLSQTAMARPDQTPGLVSPLGLLEGALSFFVIKPASAKPSDYGVPTC